MFNFVAPWSQQGGLSRVLDKLLNNCCVMVNRARCVFAHVFFLSDPVYFHRGSYRIAVPNLRGVLKRIWRLGRFSKGYVKLSTQFNLINSIELHSVVRVERYFIICKYFQLINVCIANIQYRQKPIVNLLLIDTVLRNNISSIILSSKLMIFLIETLIRSKCFLPNLISYFNAYCVKIDCNKRLLTRMFQAFSFFATLNFAVALLAN